MHLVYVPRNWSAKPYRFLACVSSVAAYAGSLAENTIEEAAIAAAVSPARSEPGQLSSILNDVLGEGLTSAGPQNEWSVSPVPICPYSTWGDGFALMK